MTAPKALNGNTRRRSPAQTQEYVDVQSGLPLTALLALTSFATIASTKLLGPHLIVTLLLFPQLVGMVCFCSLVIRVKEGVLSWKSGPGWLRGQVPLAQIVSMRVIKTRLAFGWGLRRSRFGWRFARETALALELHCRGGRRLRLGTARAHELRRFLERMSVPWETLS